MISARVWAMAAIASCLISGAHAISDKQKMQSVLVMHEDGMIDIEMPPSDDSHTSRKLLKTITLSAGDVTFHSKYHFSFEHDSGNGQCKYKDNSYWKCWQYDDESKSRSKKTNGGEKKDMTPDPAPAPDSEDPPTGDTVNRNNNMNPSPPPENTPDDPPAAAPEDDGDDDADAPDPDDADDADDAPDAPEPEDDDDATPPATPPSTPPSGGSSLTGTVLADNIGVSSSGCGDSKIVAMLALENDVRGDVNSDNLSCDETLATMAVEWSRGQCEARKMSHDGFTDDTISPTRCDEVLSVTGSTCGENVAWNTFPVDGEQVTKVHDGWFESAGHRENMENNDFKSVGYGFYICATGTTAQQWDGPSIYWTTLYGGATTN